MCGVNWQKCIALCQTAAALQGATKRPSTGEAAYLQWHRLTNIFFNPLEVFTLKTSNTRALRLTVITALAALSLGLSVQAQPGMGGGMGQGNGGGMGQGNGMGAGQGRNVTLNKDNTLGWTLMTPQERSAHRTNMLSAKTYDECKAVQAAQHAQMTERAKAQGKTLPTPRANGCDRMKAKGFFG